MKAAQLIFLIGLLFTTPLSRPPAVGVSWERLILGRVQSGEWITWVRPESCDHFSMGGKTKELDQIVQNCHGKKNRLWLPSSTREHIRQVKAFAQKSDLCLGHAISETEKRRLGLTLPNCDDRSDVGSFQLPKTKFPRRVFWLKPHGILILADAKANELEKLFDEVGKALSTDDQIRKVILPQHGRRAGLSATALRSLKRLGRRTGPLIAFSSDRGRYAKSRLDLKTKRLLKNFSYLSVPSSTFGNIHVELQE